jgi:hypothetical protein
MDVADKISMSKVIYLQYLENIHNFGIGHLYLLHVMHKC